MPKATSNATSSNRVKLTSHLGRDFAASLVVFLISLPLSMGIAIAAGLPPERGLVTAVIGGIVVGVLGGAPLQVTGPSAGLSVLVLQLNGEFGFETFAIMVIFAGVLQIIAGLARFGRRFQAVSPAVIRGMLAGIGILIVLSQFHVMLDRPIPGTGLDNVLGVPASVLAIFANPGDTAHIEAALIGVMTLVVIFGWDRFKPKNLAIVPGALLGVVLACTLAAVFDLPVQYIAVPEGLESFVSFPDPATALSNIDSNALVAGIGLAFVASAETLLCASAVSRMHHYGSTNYDRELFANGIANILIGLVGAMPCSGVISRSTANVEAGARTRLAAPLHAVWVACFVMFLPDLLALIPTSSLAAILIYVGIKLINPPAIRSIARFGWPVLSVLLVTLLGVVFVDLLKGIVAGFVLSAVRLMYKMSHVEFELDKLPDPDGDGPKLARWDLHMRGSATFLGLPQLQDVLDDVEPEVELHFHFDDLEFIDHACLDLLNEFRKQHEAKGGKVVVEWGELHQLRHRNSPESEVTLATKKSG